MSLLCPSAPLLLSPRLKILAQVGALEGLTCYLQDDPVQLHLFETSSSGLGWPDTPTIIPLKLQYLVVLVYHPRLSSSN